MFKKKKIVNSRTVGLITLMESKSPISEQYRTLHYNILYSMMDQKLNSLMITSAGPGEGKSTVASNLSVVFASSGNRVLLVDADMRKPTLAKSFELNNERGLSELLLENKPIENYIKRTVVENLDLIASGKEPSNPAKILGSEAMLNVLQEMKSRYDIVIFDVPPLMAASDAQVLGEIVDGTVFVIREYVTDNKAAIKANELLQLARVNVLGTVYNGMAKKKKYGYYDYYNQ